MKREVDINKISDGKRYSASDMVKIGCNDCEGCSSCCEDMAHLIILDPYDIYRMLSLLTDDSFETLVDRYIEFTVDEGVILPSLKMNPDTLKCSFLSETGRCSIHNVRPGICRLFPLGRIYEDGSFNYFNQVNECSYPQKTKVKIKKWLGTDELPRYEKYISDWHYFIKDIQKYLETASSEETSQINSFLLKFFYSNSYGDDFYKDFYERIAKIKALL